MSCCNESNSTPLTIFGHVVDPQEPWRRKQWWLASRTLACMRCPIQRHSVGLDWCGEPYPARVIAWISDLIRLRKPRRFDGCGCVLNVKRQRERAKCPANRWSEMQNLQPPRVVRNAQGIVQVGLPRKVGDRNGRQSVESNGVHRSGLRDRR